MSAPAVPAPSPAGRAGNHDAPSPKVAPEQRFAVVLAAATQEGEQARRRAEAKEADKTQQAAPGEVVAGALAAMAHRIAPAVASPVADRTPARRSGSEVHTIAAGAAVQPSSTSRGHVLPDQALAATAVPPAQPGTSEERRPVRPSRGVVATGQPAPDQQAAGERHSYVPPVVAAKLQGTDRQLAAVPNAPLQRAAREASPPSEPSTAPAAAPSQVRLRQATGTPAAAAVDEHSTGLEPSATTGAATAHGPAPVPLAPAKATNPGGPGDPPVGLAAAETGPQAQGTPRPSPVGHAQPRPTVGAGGPRDPGAAPTDEAHGAPGRAAPVTSQTTAEAGRTKAAARTSPPMLRPAAATTGQPAPVLQDGHGTAVPGQPWPAVAPQPTSRQVSAALVQHLAQLPAPSRGTAGTWTLSVELDPPQLGRVEAVVTLGPTGLSVLLVPSAPAAQQVLQQASQHIATNLGATVTVSTGTGPGSGSGHQPASVPGPSPAGSDEGAEPDEPATAPPATHGSYIFA